MEGGVVEKGGGGRLRGVRVERGNCLRHQHVTSRKRV